MSSSWIDLVPAIVNTTLPLGPRRILDLGMGAGKYGFLIREQGDFAGGRWARSQWRLRIEGVEGYSAAVREHQHAVYDHIHPCDVMEFLQSYRGSPYDVALAIDIIEHFEPEAGVDFVRRALSIARFVLVSTPRGYFQQDGQGNVLDEHRSWWPTKALRPLARRCEAQISIGHVYMANVALLSRSQQPPRISQRRLRTALRFLRDLLLPESLYYRAIGGTGPSIL